MTAASADMTTVNPKIDGKHTTLAKLIDNLPRASNAKITIKGEQFIADWYDWSSVNNSWSWHLQGIAPYNGYAGSIMNGCIAASGSAGYFATFSQEPNKSATVKQVVLPDVAYVHAAGIQLLGDYLPVPLERSSGTAKVVFYDVSRMDHCLELYSIEMKGDKASAVAIAAYTDPASGIEYAILAVYEYDDRAMYWYRAPVEQLGAATSPWAYMGAYIDDALHGTQYQCFSLVTQSGDQGDEVFLVGYNEAEEIHLFTVDLGPTPAYGWLTPAQTFKGWSGTDWRYGGIGLQLVDPTHIRLFASDKDPTGNTSDYEMKVHIWARD